MRKNLILAALVALPFFVAGCGGGNSATAVNPITYPGSSSGSGSSGSSTTPTYQGTYTGTFSGIDSEGTMSLTISSSGAVSGTVTMAVVGTTTTLTGTVESSASAVSSGAVTIVATGSNSTYFPISFSGSFTGTSTPYSAYGTYSTAVYTASGATDGYWVITPVSSSSSARKM